MSARPAILDLRRDHGSMGTSKRYADSVDRQLDTRILQRAATSAPLQSLSPTELRLDEVPLTVDPRPSRKVKVGVRFGRTPMRVDAVGARWTPDAVGIVFTVNGFEHRCWVWTGAIEKIEAPAARGTRSAAVSR